MHADAPHLDGQYAAFGRVTEGIEFVDEIATCETDANDKPLKDINLFMNSCTILNDTLAWDISGSRDASKCIDIDPDMLHSLEHATERFSA